MSKFAILWHLSESHRIRQTVEAESVSDARARALEGLRRGGDGLAFFEVRAGDLFLIPVTSLRCIQIVEADRPPAPLAWEIADEPISG
jgi:hypothetical protein